MSRLLRGLCLIVVGCSASAASAATVEMGGIVWETDLVSAYNASLREEKPICVLFVREGDYYCNKVRAQLEEHKLLAPYQDHAIFVIADLDKDDAAGNISQMVASLNVELIPSLVLMRTSTTAIEEVSRVTGQYPVDKAAVLLGRLFDPIVFPPAPAVPAEPAVELPAAEHSENDDQSPADPAGAP